MRKGIVESLVIQSVYTTVCILYRNKNYGDLKYNNIIILAVITIEAAID